MRREQLLNGLKKTRGYWKLEGEALHYNAWRTRFGRGYGPVVTQTKKWMKNNFLSCGAID